jgi:Fe-S cluster biogenesis protein NfuA
VSEELTAQVRDVLEKDVRPRLQGDGGDVELVEVSAQGVVKVRLTGHCAGCPFSAMTLAFGVEQTLKEKVPGVVRVEPVA